MTRRISIPNMFFSGTISLCLAVLVSVSASAETSCPDVSEEKENYDASDYFERDIPTMLGPEHQLLPGKDNPCMEELIILARLGAPEGEQMLDEIAENAVGDLVRYLIVTPISEMSLSGVMTRLSEIDDRSMRISVVWGLPSDAGLEVDLASEEIRRWMPDNSDLEFAVDFAQIMSRFTGDEDFWKETIAKVLFPPDQRPDQLATDRLIETVLQSDEADVEVPAAWADQFVARFPDWIAERHDKFHVNHPLDYEMKILEALPAEQVERIITHLKRHETARLVRYGMLIELRSDPSYPALLALVDLGFSAGDLVDDLGGRHLDAILRGSLTSDRPSTAVDLFENFSCQRLMEAGISPKRVSSFEPVDSPVRIALQELINSGRCAHSGLLYDVLARNSDFDALLEDLNDEGTGFTYNARPNLPDDPNSDFRELPIRGGILIHDQCYKDERLQELGGTQSAIEETIATFAVCQKEIREWQPGGAAENQHIPRLMEVINGEIDRVPVGNYKDSRGVVHRVDDPCLDGENFSEDFDIAPRCRDRRSYRSNQLKVFCQMNGDFSNEVVLLQEDGSATSRVVTHGTAQGSRHGMTFVNWPDSEDHITTSVYNGPFIQFNPQRRVSRGELISTLGHELVHTLYARNTHSGDYPLNDFATMCEAACFYDDWSKERISDDELYTAFNSCNSMGRPDRDTRSSAQRIRNKL